ncbi:MAG TPA: DUF2796 domain-containing protein [Quisquiliibacterium sp.]|nr:DUF2796 domain-containing protein [Quisquiliibacterium sp.]
MRPHVVLLTAIALALPGAALPPAVAGPAHQHGVARLTVAVDGPTLTLELETPLDSVLGFEHAPRTERHRAQVREMARRLRQSGTLRRSEERPGLPQPSEGAGCVARQFDLRSAVLPPALLTEHEATPASAAAPATAPAPANTAAHNHAHARARTDATAADAGATAAHADLEARWVFACARPPQLRSLEVRLFDAFPKLQRIDAEVAGPTTQSGTRLTPARRVVRW